MTGQEVLTIRFVFLRQGRMVLNKRLLLQITQPIQLLGQAPITVHLVKAMS
ncbi:hypothetical protein LLT7_10415 [Lactococcus cremoris subsp. cremoris TIFN7]|nr:hypothetical protein LLT7_10415 [Lactococcus cremoris subsp. cremoris TIFN7]